MEEEKTKGVQNLLGDPKKAVLIMAVPLIVSMLAQSINNIIDTVWVAGLGSTAVAATGFVFPIFMTLIGIGNGLGIGASSAISKHIGADDRTGASRVAFQAVMLSVTIGVILTAFFLLIENPLIGAMGAGDATQASIDYATPLIIGMLVIILDIVFANLLRSEGDSKRAMYTQTLAAVLNVILDPIFIYAPGDIPWLPIGLGMGVAGAAWATVLSMGIALMIQLYWFFVKRTTYLDLVHHKIRWHKHEDKEILVVGIPSSFEMFVMSLATLFLNIIIGMNGDYVDNVTINTCVWKVMNLFMMPLMALSGAIVPVFGANYGANRPDNIKVGYHFALQLGIVMMIFCIGISFFFGESIMKLFTYGEDMESLRPIMAEVLWKTSLALPFIATGFVATGFFQSMGMGVKSLICCTIRNFMQLPSTMILTGISMSMTVLLWGVAIGEILGSLLTFVWSYIMLHKLLRGELKQFRTAES